MSLSYCWQCSMEAVSILVSGRPFDERLKSASVSFLKLRNTRPIEFADIINSISDRLVDLANLNDTEKERLADEILSFHQKMCAHNAEIYIGE